MLGPELYYPIYLLTPPLALESYAHVSQDLGTQVEGYIGLFVESEAECLGSRV